MFEHDYEDEGAGCLALIFYAICFMLIVAGSVKLIEAVEGIHQELKELNQSARVERQYKPFDQGVNK